MNHKQILQLQNQLLIWYQKEGRKDLPWRNLDKKENEAGFDRRLKHINKAYAVYISEIMLQQTQVSRVLQYFYFPFLYKFPSMNSLANAKENEILKAWQGLGYYNRARNLKACALECMQNHKGVLPRQKEELIRLKGIGAYTAGAISCFGYNQKVAFIDGNIKRVLSRLFKLKNASLKELESLAYKLLNQNDAFNHNQALIDLGALICTPKVAKCNICPLYVFCEARLEYANYPENKKRQYEKINLYALLITYKNAIFLQKSTKKLYEGLYNPVLLDTQPTNAHFLGSFKHSYTQYRLNIQLYHKEASDKENLEFIQTQELDRYPLSSLCLKALTLLEKKGFLKLNHSSTARLL